MAYPASAIGKETPTTTQRIDAREALAYAAGVSAHETCFLNDAQPDFTALPFICVRLEWPVMLAARSLLGACMTAGELARAVHATQDTLFLAPIRTGRAYQSHGRILAARQIRSGVLATLRIDTFDADANRHVTTTWNSTIYRGARLEGAAHALEAPPPAPAGAGLSARVTEVSEAVTTPASAQVYSACADIWNPIHTEQRAAAAAGLDGPILHGTMTWALAGLAVLRRRGAEEAHRLRRLSARFCGMASPGDTLAIEQSWAPGDDVVGLRVSRLAGGGVLDQAYAVFG